MKIALMLSLMVNAVLGWFVFTAEPEVKEVVKERLIIETHAEKAAAPLRKPLETKMKPTPSSETKVTESQDDLPPPVLLPLDEHDVQNAAEKMELDRQEFLTRELSMSEEKIAEHNRLRDEYYKNMAQYWEKNPMRELSFKERRKMIDMEEKLHSKLEKLHGKENWKKYQDYRESYNQKGFKKQVEENQPFLFMGL